MYFILLNRISLRMTRYESDPFLWVSSSESFFTSTEYGPRPAFVAFNVCSDFSHAGFNSSLLKSFGDAFNCRYIFIGQAVVTKSESDASLTIVWSFGRKSVLHAVKYYGQIWDVQSKRQVWEGSGVASSLMGSFENQPLIEEMASQAVDSMLKTISSKGAHR